MQSINKKERNNAKMPNASIPNAFPSPIQPMHCSHAKDNKGIDNFRREAHGRNSFDSSISESLMMMMMMKSIRR
jgi:hypothetical protein